MNTENKEEINQMLLPSSANQNPSLSMENLETKGEKVNFAKQKKISQILEELIESEKKYVEDLQAICRDYMSPPFDDGVYYSLDRKYLKSLRRRGSNMVVTNSTSQLANIDCHCPSPSTREMRQIFCNIEDLRDYHSNVFLPGLQKSILSERKLREWFESEQSKLTRKYGRYCINYTNAISIVKEHINYFSIFQLKNKLLLRIDGMLIKPIQRLTRYHMFLKSVSQHCYQQPEDSLDTSEEQEYRFDLTSMLAGHEYRLAYASVLAAAEHTNTMMWVGTMSQCPLDLSAQGQLLKYGPVSFLNSPRRERSWFLSSKKKNSNYLFLFQQSVIVCHAQDKIGRRADTDKSTSTPDITFCCVLSVNQIRIRDTVEAGDNIFEIQRLENMDMDIISADKIKGRSGYVSVSKLRILCPTLEDKICWVTSINNEIKQLKSFAKLLSFS